MEQIEPIIKYEVDDSTFIWNHPFEDFNPTTQLIVHESQEAMFHMEGQALDLLDWVGTHLKPKISQLLKIPQYSNR